jgi:exopolysaccharide biosynthesis polyprenyl glycosylphosphotransferase
MPPAKAVFSCSTYRQKNITMETLMKRHNLFFLGILVPFDYIALILAAASAYSLRFGPFSELLQTTITISFADYLANAAVFALIFIVIYAFSGLYADRVRRRLAAEFPRIVTASSTGIAILIVAIFFQRQYFASRFIVLAAWIFAIVYVFAGRGLVRLVRYILLRYGYGILRFAAVGTTETADEIVQAYDHERRWGTKISARFPSWNDATQKQLAAMRERELIDGIILTDPNMARKDIVSIQSFCADHHLMFRYVADLLGTERASIETTMIGSVPVIEVKRTPLEGWGAIAKRVFDVVVSLVIAIILSPVIAIVALAVKLSSKGPIIFKNERVGEQGKLFNTYKFRSMYADKSIGSQGGLGNQDEALKLEEKLIKEQSIKQGPLYKIKDDPRITPVGRFIRATSLDELPQLFNVILGSMSLVGPRPHQPREVEKYSPSQKRVLAIKPGITGLAQISGRSDIPFEEEVRLDNYYIEHWSPYLDLIILVKTPLAVFSRKGTY